MIAQLAEATARLAAVSDTPRLDAELLLAHSLGISREQLLLGGLRAVPENFVALIDRRAGGEPLAYIVGTRDFWTIALEVGPGVLVPRPDSETLIEAAVAHFGNGAPATILDLGTGPGTLLLAALDQWPSATGLGIDRSADALAYACRNAARLGLADRTCFSCGDWLDGVDARFDLILANPPYIPLGETLSQTVSDHEPHSALFAGADGFDDHRRLAPILSGHLVPGGLALVEIGHDQGPAALELYRQGGGQICLLQDLGQRDRALAITLSH